MPNILIVDNEIAVVKVLESKLQGVPGYQVSTAASFERANDMMDKEEFELVTTEK